MGAIIIILILKSFLPHNSYSNNRKHVTGGWIGMIDVFKVSNIGCWSLALFNALRRTPVSQPSTEKPIDALRLIILRTQRYAFMLLFILLSTQGQNENPLKRDPFLSSNKKNKQIFYNRRRRMRWKVCSYQLSSKKG